MRFFLIPMMLFFFVQFSFAQQNDTALNKMRTFRIRNKALVGLQMPIDSLKDIVVKKQFCLYSLKKGTFGGTDSIDIEVNASNKIINVCFFYDTVSTYSYEVDLFNKHLNRIGIETKHNSGSNKIKYTKWEDGYTVFELIEIRKGNKWKLYSRLYDKSSLSCFDRIYIEEHKGVCTFACPG